MDSMAQNLARLQERIARAAQRVGREPEKIGLVAVSKTVDAPRVRAAHAAGLRVFGENRAQELRDKSRELSDLSLEWHFVGSIQTNKVRYIVPTAELVHSVDRLAVARRISQRASAERPQRLLVQVNTSGEESKSGVQPDALDALLEGLAELPHLRVEGLMTIGPLTDDQRAIGSAFRLLRRLRDRARDAQHPRMPLQHLSMGMTHDFELAIAEGATLLRIGTAIFGRREA
ncbi:MAG: YggS family pyridoxal phosphate-dependent enzyme [Candidatus Eisenbacteria bacterium]|nr:YggS family pyridoxal phosphate-dependent enzyme [Candidatus Eisenbacteria bacterium]